MHIDLFLELGMVKKKLFNYPAQCSVCAEHYYSAFLYSKVRKTFVEQLNIIFLKPLKSLYLSCYNITYIL